MTLPAQSYDSAFFKGLDETSTTSAQAIVPHLAKILDFASVVDFGCGVGAWLKEVHALGLRDYVGVDGSYVDRAQLRIDEHHFLERDLTRPVDLGRRFDLGFCLEVGEHLPAASAPALVQTIGRHVDAVLFSAAIPHQGGTHHVNEQWPEYWAKLFRDEGFACFDCIRPAFWEAEEVAWWFRQNILLYVRPAATSRFREPVHIEPFRSQIPRALVAPELYLGNSTKLSQMQTLASPPPLGWALRALCRSATASLRHHLRFRAA